MRVVQIRRRPSEAFGPAPLGFPPQPPMDLGAGLSVGAEVWVTLLDDALRKGVVTALDADWLTVELVP